MAQDVPNAKRKKKSLLPRVAVLMFALYLLGSIVSSQLVLTEIRSELAQAKKQHQELELTNRELDRMLKSDSDEDYARRVARENGWAYPGEQIYKFIQ